MQLGHTALFHFLSLVLKSVAGFIATLFIARTLGPEALGIYAIVSAILAWGSVPSSAVDQAIVKRMSEGENTGEFFVAGVAINAAISIILAVGVIILRETINDYIGLPFAYIVAGLLIINALFWTVVSGLRGQKRVAWAGFAQVVNQWSRTLAQIVLILLGFGIVGVLIGHGLSLLLAGGIGLAWYGLRPEVPSFKDIRSLYRYARYSWFNLIQSRTISSMDIIILGFFVHSALIGIYQVAWTLASILFLFSNSIRSTLFPEMSDLSERAEYNQIRHLLDEALTFSGLLIIPGIFGAAILGHRILRIYQPEFTKGAIVLLILILARLLNSYGEQFIGVINAIDRPDLTFRINILFLFANLGLNIVLIHTFGWYGAAVATATSAGIMLVLGFWFLQREVGRLSIPFAELGYEFAASGLMAIIVYGLVQISPPSNLFTVVLVGIGAIIYGVVVVTLSGRIRDKVFTIIPFSIGKYVAQ